MSYGIFQFRRGTASQWTAANTSLAPGEIGIETDTHLFKIGDGVTAWNSLAYGGLQGTQGVPGTSPNAFTTITGGSGTATADTSSDSLLITGASGITTVVTDNPEIVTISPTYGTAASTITQGNDTRVVNAVQTSRTVTAGAGMTGGGALSGNITLDVIANADGSLIVSADDIKVGVINDTQHGTRGGGTLHANANSTTAGFLTASQFNFITAYNGPGIIFVTSNTYSNLKCDGATDDLAALNSLYSGAPDGSTLVWPGQNTTMVLSGAASVPSGKHFIHVGGGPGNKTNILQTSLTADHFTCNDWYSTWTGFNFTTNFAQCTTNGQALTSGTVITISAINTALVPATGTINIGSTAGYQALTYSARTATSVTLSQTGTGTTMVFPGSAATGPVVFKTAGAAINAGNLVGIDCQANTFSYCFNGYICAGSTANQSRITSNGFLNTINFDIWIDGANWNGIIDSNTCDCTIASRSLSHCEITQVGSVTGQGNQFIRGQYNMRLGSTTAAYPAGAFGVYFSNCFFDNAGIDAVKIQGISAVQRVKLTSCWLSSAAQKGLNFASTASTLPTDIELIGCNIYSNGTDGIGGAGVQDYKITGGQVAGNVTNGINIAPATGNVYSVVAEAVRIGPTGGIGANGTGINIAAGTYTQIKFDACDATGNTTVFTAGAVTVATASKYSITNCSGINPRGAVTTPGVPGIGATVTNTTGFRVLAICKYGTTAATAVVLNGVSCANTPLASQQGQFFLEPGATIAFTTATIVSWTWAGM